MRAGLSIAGFVAVVFGAGVLQADEWRFCGDDYWFTAEPPEGWELSSDMPTLGLALTFQPAGGSEDEVIMAILPTGSGSFEARSVDLDAELTRWMSLVNAFGAPSRILSWEMQHPTQPTRSAVARGEGGSLYLSVIDAGSGRGHTFAVFLLQAGGSAAEKTLRSFRAIVSSLRFDATRRCGPGPDGHVLDLRIPPAEAPPLAEPPEAGFPIDRAMSGCDMLQQLFVPVYCYPALAEERKAWGVSFDDGDEPAESYLGRHRDRVTSPWCWSARGRADTPALLFTTKDSDSLEEYSCETSGWTRSVQRDRVTRSR